MRKTSTTNVEQTSELDIQQSNQVTNNNTPAPPELIVPGIDTLAVDQLM